MHTYEQITHADGAVIVRDPVAGRLATVPPPGAKHQVLRPRQEILVAVEVDDHGNPITGDPATSQVVIYTDRITGRLGLSLDPDRGLVVATRGTR